eukprot:jgi/Ulvmu1/4062/UM019_0040.1
MHGTRLIPASKLHVSKPTWWLESRFHFSFADYFNPQNMNFGALRVMNDDLVKPRSGFGRHPHRDAEIFSYIVDGKLSHADSMGNSEALGRGSVQFMSAGTGVTHSEMNDGDETCRFIQVWLTPDARGHRPQYGSTVFSDGDRHNQLLHILGGTGEVPSWDKVNKGSGNVKLHQDANVFVSEADANHAFEVLLGRARQAYLLCIEGGLHVNDTKLSARDAAEITAPSNAIPLSIRTGSSGSHFMLIEMAQEE